MTSPRGDKDSLDWMMGLAKSFLTTETVIDQGLDKVGEFLRRFDKPEPAQEQGTRRCECGHVKGRHSTVELRNCWDCSCESFSARPADEPDSTSRQLRDLVKENRQLRERLDTAREHERGQVVKHLRLVAYASRFWDARTLLEALAREIENGEHRKENRDE